MSLVKNITGDDQSGELFSSTDMEVDVTGVSESGDQNNKSRGEGMDETSWVTFPTDDSTLSAETQPPMYIAETTTLVMAMYKKLRMPLSLTLLLKLKHLTQQVCQIRTTQFVTPVMLLQKVSCHVHVMVVVVGALVEMVVEGHVTRWK